MALTGAQAKEFEVALLDAYRTRGTLQRMLMHELNVDLNQLVAEAAGLRAVVYELVQEFDRLGQVEVLVTGVVRENPDNPALRAYYEKYWLAVTSPPRREFESLIREQSGFLDYEPWAERLLEMGRRVCRVEVAMQPESVYGTGFLLGPDLIMTNYHVLEAVILGEHGRTTVGGTSAKASDVVFLFDYKRLPNGKIFREGVRYGLEGSALQDWLVDSSPYSPYDEQPIPAGDPAPNELDFALVRLSGSPGEPPRGWVNLPGAAPDIQAGTGLFILQHPAKEQLQLAIETDAIVEYNDNRTRVTYRTNTLRGSSGAPCFDSSWNLAALHHLGDPNFGRKVNQGIPISAITNLLEQHRKRDQLGRPKVTE